MKTGIYYLGDFSLKFKLPYEIGEKIDRFICENRKKSYIRFEIRGLITTKELTVLNLDNDETLLLKSIGNQYLKLKNTDCSLLFEPYKFFHCPIMIIK